jgi:flagellin-like protein
MMKGITPIVTVILLLLIAVVMVGFAFGFFTNIFETTATQTQTQVQETTGQLGKSVRVESAAGTTIYLRNVGTTAIEIAEIRIFNSTGGNDLTSGNCPGSSLAAGSVGSCTLTTCPTGTKIRVTAPGNTVTYTCT